VWPQHVLFVRPLHPVDGNDTNPRTDGGKNRGDSSAFEPYTEHSAVMVAIFVDAATASNAGTRRLQST